MRTRLDAVVQVRERAEEKALRQVVEAETQAKAALERAEALKKVAQQDQRQPGDAATWELAETAHVRALSDARKAQKEGLAVMDGPRLKLTDEGLDVHSAISARLM
jgi:regulator of protease activity HflC (stomatin/prohibitin superfamily)